MPTFDPRDPRLYWNNPDNVRRARAAQPQPFTKTSMTINLEHIARTCHEINRAYCEALGDNSQPAWDDAPLWQRSSAFAGVTLHLTHPDAGPEASHASWMQQKIDEGWKYGAYKDVEAKLHPCIVPFAELPRDQQAKDYLFRAVVHAMVKLKAELG